MLTQQLDVNTIIERVGDKVRELVKEDNIGIGLYDLETNTVTAHYVTKGKERIQYPPFPINLFTQKAALQGKTLIINRRSPILWKKLGSNMTAANEIPQSVVMIPMIVGKELIGGFTIQNFERENAYDDSIIKLMESIASGAATAIQNARLSEEDRSARAAAEQANDAKSAFLATMSKPAVAPEPRVKPIDVPSSRPIVRPTRSAPSENAASSGNRNAERSSTVPSLIVRGTSA